MSVEGRHVVVVTPTASGKTLCYNVPVLSAVLEFTQRPVRCICFQPRRSPRTSSPSLQTLSERLRAHGDEVGAYHLRRRYAAGRPPGHPGSRAHIVLSNPEMLHSGILPHHPRWAKLFENLRFVVVDELHAYRGVFGSHLANVLRTVATGVPALWVGAGVRLLVGHHRQPARAGGVADGTAEWSSWMRAAHRAARSASSWSILRWSTATWASVARICRKRGIWRSSS